MMELLTHWVTQYGYLGLFALLMLGIIGLPIPEETLLAFAGVLVYRGHLDLVPTLAAAFLGSCCGITVSYSLGRTLGLRVIARWGPKVGVTPERLENVHGWFDRVGHWSLFVGYFLPGVRHLTAIIAGTARLEYPAFAVFAYAGALTWSFTFVSLGVFVGRAWLRVSEQVHRNLAIGSVALAVLALLAWVVVRHVRRGRGGR